MSSLVEERRVADRPVTPRRAEVRRRRRARIRRRRAAATVLVVSLSALVLSQLDVLDEGRLPLPDSRDQVVQAAGSLSGGSGGVEAAFAPGEAPSQAETAPGSGALLNGEIVPPDGIDPLHPYAVPGGQAFAKARTMTLYVPGRRVLGIAYHQAKSELSLPIRPLGTLAANDNPKYFRPPRATAGPRYIVLESRERGTHPTTAVDVALGRRDPVLAPISGVVTAVFEYALYGAWPDMRVEINPKDGSRLLLVMIHLTDVQVRKGQRVVAGVTPLGLARTLPERSYINDYVGEGVPHVHIEVKELGTPGQ